MDGMDGWGGHNGVAQRRACGSTFDGSGRFFFCSFGNGPSNFFSSLQTLSCPVKSGLVHVATWLSDHMHQTGPGQRGDRVW